MPHDQEMGKLMFWGIDDAAPVFGMICTLFGLIQMLASLEGPASISPVMNEAI